MPGHGLVIGLECQNFAAVLLLLQIWHGPVRVLRCRLTMAFARRLIRCTCVSAGKISVMSASVDIILVIEECIIFVLVDVSLTLGRS